MPDDVKPASPLPWRLEPGESKVPEIESAKGDRVTGLCNGAGDYDVGPADRAYIVAACNAYPGLVARVAELEAELAKKDELLHECLPAVRNNAQAEAEGGDPFAAAAWNVIADCVEASLAPKEPQ